MSSVKDFLYDKDNNIEVQYVKQLYQRPVKPKYTPTYPHLDKDVWHQADLLYLPNDKGYEYALVVADVGTRLVDAEPIKDKTSNTVKKALNKIYRRGILNKPERMSIDKGTEFKGNFLKMLEEMDIQVKVAKTGRSRMLAIVERKNQTIGKVLHQLIVRDEVMTGEASSAWTGYLPELIKEINDIVKKNMNKKKVKEATTPLLEPNTVLLDIGTPVRVALDKPKSFQGTKLSGRFRSSDIRFDPDIRKIENIYLKVGQPPMYILDDDPHIAYTADQLQVANINITPQLKENVDSVRLEVEKILDRKEENGITLYLIKWKKLPKKQASWEARENIYEDIKRMVDNFDKKLVKHTI